MNMGPSIGDILWDWGVQIGMAEIKEDTDGYCGRWRKGPWNEKVIMMMVGCEPQG